MADEDLGLALDTTAVSILLKLSNNPSVEERRGFVSTAIRGKLVYVSFAVVAELLEWAEVHGWGDARKAQLEDRLSKFVVLDPTRVTAEIWARLKSNTRARGIATGDNDCWIAASAIEYDLPLSTFDGNFARMGSGLRLLATH